MKKRLINAVFLAVNTFEMALSTTHNVVKLSEAPTGEEFEALALQGGSLEKANKARKGLKKHELSKDFNLKVVDKSWKEGLVNGEAVAITVEQSRVKQPLTQHLKEAIDYTTSKHPNIKFHKVENKRYAVLLMYVDSGKETKAEPKQEKQENEQS